MIHLIKHVIFFKFLNIKYQKISIVKSDDSSLI